MSKRAKGITRDQRQHQIASISMLTINFTGLAAALTGCWYAFTDPSAVALPASLLVLLLILAINIGAFWLFRAIRKRNTAYRGAFVSLILDSIDAAVTVYDSTGRLVRANRGAERLSGFSEAELKNPETWKHILPGINYEKVTGILVGRPASDYPITNTNPWVARDGTERLLRWSNVALTDDDGQVALIVCIGFDITEQRRFEKDLINAKNDAVLASRAKSEFLANMSHELRTPLNAILGFAEVIRDQRMGGNAETYRNYAVDIYDSGQMLLQLITDLLDMAKLESGQVVLHETELDVEAIIAASRRMVLARAEEGSVRLAVDVQPHLPPMRGGERALKQIVLNLLSNAVKFTPQGGKAAIKAGLNAQGGIEITVSDTGIGIPPEAIERLFQPFYQVDAKISRRYGGTGLGLAITKKLVDAHDGQIAVASIPGEGTHVTVSFPPARTLVPAGR
ncbi:sensor histidine kinase [Dongia sp.]|uniref:sensor histidine kinase n=1 Tax=Dongia sp. TaxID=1977262 RepID=UPI0035B2DEF7